MIVLDNDQDSINEFPCGLVEIKFPNLAQINKEKLSSTLELASVNFENKPLPSEPSIIISIYVFIICVAVIGLYVVVQKQYYSKSSFFGKNKKVAICLAITLSTIALTVVYLGYKLLLIENIMIVVIEVGLFTYIFSKVV